MRLNLKHMVAPTEIAYDPDQLSFPDYLLPVDRADEAEVGRRKWLHVTIRMTPANARSPLHQVFHGYLTFLVGVLTFNVNRPPTLVGLVLADSWEIPRITPEAARGMASA